MDGMERLTSREPRVSGMPGVCCTHFEGSDCQAIQGRCADGCPWEEAAWESLASYEDTGLTPKEINEHEAAYIEIMTRTYGPLHQKIGQWLQAEQDGRLAVLPCKVGDTIYVILRGRIIETTVRTFFFGYPSYGIEGREMRMIRTINWDIPMDEFGTRIFLTREEAEAALTKRKECSE